MHKFTGTKFIIFDLDGTLIDGYQAITESLNTVLKHMGQPTVPQSMVKFMVGTGLENLLANFVEKDKLPEAVRMFREHFKQVCLTGSFLLEGVGPVLERFKRSGIRMGVASNKPGERVRDICRHLKIDQYFEVMVGAMDVQELKPHPQMVQETMRRMGATAHQTLYVGDMHVDVQTARAAGLPVVCVLTGSSTHGQLTDAAPDAIVEDLEGLAELLGISGSAAKDRH